MKVIVGVTGATGSIYAKHFIEILSANACEIHFVASRRGEEVGKYELGNEKWQSLIEKAHKTYNVDQMWGSIASGSFAVDAMVVVPCSMRTVASIANGISDNLLLRAADVTIKERRKLVLVPRETPYNSIHLRNMLTLSDLGVCIMPASPGFYNRPMYLEELVDLFTMRLCDVAGLKTDLAKRWGE